MNKSELIEKIAEAVGLSKADAGRALDAFVTEVTAAMRKKKAVTIVGFGTFEAKWRAPREARNPQTNEPIKIKGAYAPRFRAGKGLKDTLKAVKK